MFDIQPYDPTRDAAAVDELWQASLGARWPLTPALLGLVLAAPGTQNAHLVARRGGRVLGLAATQMHAGQGNLTALLVAPDARRQGIGAALHDAALELLHVAGAERVQLGGGETRLWPGLPADLADARPFFAARGWLFAGETVDMTQDLRAYQPPADLRPSLAVIRVAAPADLAELLDFQRREFPGWLRAYQVAADLGDSDDFLLACDPTSGAIVGALIMATPRSHPGRTDVIWKTLLGSDAGGLGCVGIAEAARTYGAGTGLVARGIEIIRERGTSIGFIGWTTLRSFYGRLGYRDWRVYMMASQELGVRS